MQGGAFVEVMFCLTPQCTKLAKVSCSCFCFLLLVVPLYVSIQSESLVDLRCNFLQILEFQKIEWTRN
jgi:hypothetical protein